MIPCIVLSLFMTCMLGSLPNKAFASDFDPYQLNGGLVAAVAGQDFVILAADTRLTGSSGYEILERQHTSSRLWSMLPSRMAHAMQAEFRKFAANSAPIIERELDTLKENTIVLDPSPATREFPVWIGSAGCATDCEQLKRSCQALVARNLGTGELTTVQSSLPASLAVWLSQILYGRRGFPYYAFCVLAGCNAEGGHVYGYDAIGSYERLAVAVSGQGRDILQSILDRSLHSAPIEENHEVNSPLVHRVVRTSRQVKEGAEEAMAVLLRGFREVAKREITVGDSVILLCWRYNSGSNCIEPSVTFASLPEN